MENPAPNPEAPQSQPRLAAVPNPATGELIENPGQRIRALETELAAAHALEVELRDQLTGLERDIRGWRGRYADLKRDKEKSARKHALWPVGERLFTIYKEITGRKRVQFTYDRFELLKPLLKDHSADFTETEGPPANDFEKAVAAIVGRNFQHFTNQRANGTTVHYDEWERVFKNSGERDESMNRRPKDWRARAAAVDPGEITAGPRAVES